MKRLLLVVGVAIGLSAGTAEARYVRMAEAKTAVGRYIAHPADGSRINHCVRQSPTGVRCWITTTNMDLGDGVPTAMNWNVWASARGTHRICAWSFLDQPPFTPPAHRWCAAPTESARRSTVTTRPTPRIRS